MTSFYEFQKQYPNDEACLKRIMTERYGGTELDCPKCGRGAPNKTVVFGMLERDGDVMANVVPNTVQY